MWTRHAPCLAITSTCFSFYHYLRNPFLKCPFCFQWLAIEFLSSCFLFKYLNKSVFLLLYLIKRSQKMKSILLRMIHTMTFQSDKFLACIETFLGILSDISSEMVSDILCIFSDCLSGIPSDTLSSDILSDTISGISSGF